MAPPTDRPLSPPYDRPSDGTLERDPVDGPEIRDGADIRDEADGLDMRAGADTRDGADMRAGADTRDGADMRDEPDMPDEPDIRAGPEDPRADDAPCDERSRPCAVPGNGTHNAARASATVTLRKTDQPIQEVMGERDISYYSLLFGSLACHDNFYYRLQMRTACHSLHRARQIPQIARKPLNSMDLDRAKTEP